MRLIILGIKLPERIEIYGFNYKKFKTNLNS